MPTPLTPATRAVVVGLLGALLHVGALQAPAAAARPSGSDQTSRYDTYDDDPGDPPFDFDSPFDDPEPEPQAEPEPESQPAPEPAEEPEVEAAAATNPAPQPLMAPPAEPAEPPAPAPAQEVAPLILDELPRTGAGTGPALVTGALLLVLGQLATALGRRSRAATPA